MSLDFEIFVRKKVSTDRLKQFVSSQKMTLSIDDTETNTQTSSVYVLKDEAIVQLMFLYGPSPVDTRTVPYQVASVPLKFNWNFQISLSTTCSDEELQLAMSLCQFVAHEGQGVAFDPQEGRIIFPQADATIPSKKRIPQRVNIITLLWLLKFDSQKIASPDAVLRAMNDFPITLPKRFGLSNDGRLHKGTTEQFISSWITNVYPRNPVIWTGQPPLIEAEVVFGSEEKKRPIFDWELRFEDLEPIHRIEMTFNSKAFEGDEESSKRLVEFFKNMVVNLEPFYAAGYVSRNWLLSGSELMDEIGISENYNLRLGNLWLGIPARPTWLAWFGNPYLEILQSITSRLVKRSSSGIFIQIGNLPQNRDEVAIEFPVLPGELLQKELPITPAEPGRDLVRFMPASVIPKLT